MTIINPLPITLVNGTVADANQVMADFNAIVSDVNAFGTGLNSATGSSVVGFIQAGVGAVQRTSQSKMRDHISVLDFGVVGGGVVDDTVALQLAINSNTGKTLVLGPSHKISGTLTVSSDNTYLAGTGLGSFLIQVTPNVDSVLFKPPTAGITTAFLNNVGIEGVTVVHTAAAYTTATSGAGIRFLQCNGYMANAIGISEAFEGLTCQGGQNGSLKRLNLFASAGPYAGAGTALLHFRQAPVGIGFQPCFTVDVDDFYMSATLLRDTCIRISNGDGIGFGIGYVAHGKNSNLSLKAERNNSYIAACHLDGIYLDCVGAGKTLYGVYLEADGFANSFIYDLTIGDGCTIGNGDGIGVLGRKPETQTLRIGGNILNMKSWGIDVAGSITYTDLEVTAKIQNCGSNGISGNIRADTGRTLNVSAQHAISTNVCIETLGNWFSGSIVGNTSGSAVSDWVDTAVWTHPPVIAGNASPGFDLANSWIGLAPGNKLNNDLFTLDWYEENTFTPTLTFGGASAGMTYTSQVGEFTRIGNRVMYSVQIVLSAKGASVGAAQINALPYTCGSAQSTPAAFAIYNATAGVGDTMLFALVTSAGTTIKPYLITAGAGTAAQLTDAQFTNTTTIQLSGNYRV